MHSLRDQLRARAVCVQERGLTGRVVTFRQSAFPSLLLLLPLPSSSPSPSPSLLERHISQVQLVESVSDSSGSRRGSGGEDVYPTGGAVAVGRLLVGAESETLSSSSSSSSRREGELVSSLLSADASRCTRTSSQISHDKLWP
jgi:hypothetical protein